MFWHDFHIDYSNIIMKTKTLFMKKFFVLAAVLLIGNVCILNAQIQAGNWMVGGDLMGMDFGLNKGGGYNIQLTPKFAYFIKDNVAIGGYTDLGVNGKKGAPTTWTYKIGALGRYYASSGQVDNLLKHGRFFLEGNVGFGGESITDGGSSSNGLNIQAGPGYSYFITQNVGLEALLKYDGNFGFGNGGVINNITFGLGFQLYLPSSRVKSMINNPKNL